MLKRPFLVLNSIGALWLASGAIVVLFHWRGIGAFPLIGDWLGMLMAALWVAGANVVLGVVVLVRWEAARASRA